MPLELLSLLNGRVDENNSLIIAAAAAGSAGPLTPGFHGRATSTTTTAYLNTADNTEGAARTPATPLGNLRVKADATDLMIGTLAAAGSLRTPPTIMGNLKGCTDENGFLIVAAVTVGSTLGPIGPIGNLKLKTDENNAVIVAIGP